MYFKVTQAFFVVNSFGQLRAKFCGCGEFIRKQTPELKRIDYANKLLQCGGHSGLKKGAALTAEYQLIFIIYNQHVGLMICSVHF